MKYLGESDETGGKVALTKVASPWAELWRFALLTSIGQRSEINFWYGSPSPAESNELIRT